MGCCPLDWLCISSLISSSWWMHYIQSVDSFLKWQTSYQLPHELSKTFDSSSCRHFIFLKMLIQTVKLREGRKEGKVVYSDWYEIFKSVLFGNTERVSQRLCGKIRTFIWTPLDFLLDTRKGKGWEEVFSCAWEMEDIPWCFKRHVFRRAQRRSEKNIPQHLTLLTVSWPILSHGSCHPCLILVT